MAAARASALTDGELLTVLLGADPLELIGGELGHEAQAADPARPARRGRGAGSAPVLRPLGAQARQAAALDVLLAQDFQG